MALQTRSQAVSKKVYKLLNQEDTKKISKAYGGLCHNFPIMVLQSGLSQAVAYILVKSKNENSPQWLFLVHLASLDAATENKSPTEFQIYIQQVDLSEYQRLTRVILNASIWFKRFAVSLLDVDSGGHEDG